MTTPEAELRAQTARLEEALGESEAQLESAAVTRAREDLAAVRDRLRLGVGHTVAALVGGTGSGKSSLFNAISGLSFADVGALRPTTQRAAACVWGDSAAALLDFLGIEEDRRIQRESELDGSDESELRGLVLLDMPDHDSIEESHSALVDRLLPMVDVLLWVVDPQKYADHALHAKYLAALGDRADAMVVLINQVDTLPAGAAETIEQSMREHLAAAHLADVPIILTSTITQQGVGHVREQLAHAVAEPSAASRTARAELRAITQRLSPNVGGAAAELPAEIAAVATRDLTRASGLAPVAGALRHAARKPIYRQPPPPQPPARATVEAIRARSANRAQHGLPPRWQQAVDAAVSSTAVMHRALEEDLAAVPLPALRLPFPRRLRLAGLIQAALGVLLGVVSALASATSAALPTTAMLVIAVGFVVVGGGVALAAHRWLRRDADRLVRDYERRVRDVVDDTVTTHLIRPAQDVVARHDRLRRALEV